MTRRIPTSPTAFDSVLLGARRLLAEDDASPVRRGPSPTDPTGTLVESGWFVLQQLRVALGVAIGEDVDRLVPDVLGRAVDFGVAPGPAVGAAAAIVDAVRIDDPERLARTIVTARRSFGDTELLAGVAALVAACSAQIGAAMALDPLLVHDELRRRAARVVPTCTAGAGRPARTPSAHRFCVTDDRCGRAVRSRRPGALGPV